VSEKLEFFLIKTAFFAPFASFFAEKTHIKGCFDQKIEHCSNFADTLMLTRHPLFRNKESHPEGDSGNFIRTRTGIFSLGFFHSPLFAK
jgi:hypothetical protein